MYSLVLLMALPGDAPAPAGPQPVIVESAGCHGGDGFLHRLFHHSDHGCYGGHVEEKHHWFHHDYGCCGGKAVITVNPTSAPAPALTPAKPLPAGEAVPPPKEKVEATSLGRIIVKLPAAAKVFVDDVPTQSNTAERTFVTPTLEPGIGYIYTLRAELLQDGKLRSDVQVVTVTAGESVAVSFPNLTSLGTSGVVTTAGQ
jgi:uncharacterized protein (TIGR03000 family)